MGAQPSSTAARPLPQRQQQSAAGGGGGHHIVPSLPAVTCPHCHHHHPSGPSNCNWTCDGPGCGRSMWHRPTAPTCRRCHREFTLTHQRHKCRLDGNVYCADCCPERLQAVFPMWGDDGSGEENDNGTHKTNAAAVTAKKDTTTTHRICKLCAVRLQLRESYKHKFIHHAHNDNEQQHHHHLHVPVRVQHEVHEEDVATRGSAAAAAAAAVASESSLQTTGTKTGEMLLASQLPNRVIAAAAAAAAASGGKKKSSSNSSGPFVAVLQGQSGSGATTCLHHLAAEQPCTDALLVHVHLPDVVSAMRSSGSTANLSKTAQILHVVTPDSILPAEQRRELTLLPIVWLVDGIEDGDDDEHGVHQQDGQQLQEATLSAVINAAHYSIVALHDDSGAAATLLNHQHPSRRQLWALQRWNADEITLFATKFWRTTTTTTGAAAATKSDNVNSDGGESTRLLHQVLRVMNADTMERYAGLPLFVHMLCEVAEAIGNVENLPTSPSQLLSVFCELRWKAAVGQAQKQQQVDVDDETRSRQEHRFKAAMEDAGDFAFSRLARKPDASSWVDSWAAAGLVVVDQSQRQQAAAEAAAAEQEQRRSLQGVHFPHRMLPDFLAARSISLRPDEDGGRLAAALPSWSRAARNSNVLMFLADFARDDDFTSVTEDVLCQHIAAIFCRHFVATAPALLRAPALLAPKSHIRQLLGVTTLLSHKACRNLLSRIQKQLVASDEQEQGGKATTKLLPVFLTLLTEFFAVEGALVAFQWLEHKMSSSTAAASSSSSSQFPSMRLLTRALLHALDHQHEHKSVAACINHLVDKYEIEFASLEDALESGSLSAVARALLKTTVITDDDEHHAGEISAAADNNNNNAIIIPTSCATLQRLILTALHEQRYDTAGMLLLKLAPQLHKHDTPEYNLLLVVAHFGLPDMMHLPFVDFAAGGPHSEAVHNHFVVKSISKKQLVEFLQKLSHNAGLNLWMCPRSDRQMKIPRESLSVLLELGVLREIRKFGEDNNCHVIVAGPRETTTLEAVDIVTELLADQEGDDDAAALKNNAAVSSAGHVDDEDGDDDDADGHDIAVAANLAASASSSSASTFFATARKSPLEELIFNADTNPHLRRLRISVPVAESHQLQLRYLSFATALWSRSIEYLEVRFLRQDVAPMLLAFRNLKELVLVDAFSSLWHRIPKQHDPRDPQSQFPALEKLSVSETTPDTMLSAEDAVALVRPFRKSLEQLTWVRHNLHLTDGVIDKVVHELGFLKADEHPHHHHKKEQSVQQQQQQPTKLGASATSSNTSAAFLWPALRKIETLSFDKEAVAQTKFELELRHVYWDHLHQEYERVEKPTSFYF